MDGQEEGGGDMVIVSARSHYSPQQQERQGQQRGGSGSGNGGRSLADGVLDEEKERQEFQAAVNAWRTGEEVPSKNKNMNKAVAERLAQQMDAEHEQSAQRLREDQDLMLHKIQKVGQD